MNNTVASALVDKAKGYGMEGVRSMVIIFIDSI